MINRLHYEMIRLYSGDPMRIQHFCKVHSYAKLIAEMEHVDASTLFILEAAALTHDIGIHLCEENGMDYVEPIAYTEEEASKLKMAYITFRYTSTAGSQEASSSNNRSSAEVPTFKVFAPFLNSSIYIDSGNSSYFYRYYQGYLRKGKDEKTFIIENYSSSYELPEVQVIYEE